MAKTKKTEEPQTETEENKTVTAENSVQNNYTNLLHQGFITLAFWMTFGLLLEGLLGYKIPAYLNDNLRRELFRLAHTHGALLSLVLIVTVICAKAEFIKPNTYAQNALRVGSVIMPLGFLLGGIWHFESDPGYLILLAPLGGVLMIFGVISCALSVKKN